MSSSGATPPATNATKPRGRLGRMMVGNGNGDLKEAGWKIVTALTLAIVVGVATMLWSVNRDIARIQSTMVTARELTATIRQEVPPAWFYGQVIRIETKLDDHTGQPAAQAHGNGGG